jgi:tetratricopeptide (TPR) repeat protein
VLAVLVAIHSLAFAAYTVHQRQARHLQLYLDAREQWRAGQLAVAAAEYRAFVAGHAAASWPLVLHQGFPAVAAGWFALGRVAAELGDVDDALDAWRRSMALEAGLGRREYRDLLLESGRGGELARFAGDELKRDPASILAAADLGAALLATDQPAGAAAAYERALAGLPAWLARHDPAWRSGLSSVEADLLSLLSVARLAAGDRVRAAAACDSIAAQQHVGVSLDRLCRAFLLADADDRAGSLAALHGYVARRPEHEALVAELRRRLDAPSEPRAPPGS